MRYFLVDDDEAVRYMLREIIEDYDFGEVVGEADNGLEISEKLLALNQVDVLLIDLLMTPQDGLETLSKIPNFQGKVVMISQMTSKDMISKAYSLGIQYYINKPINRTIVSEVLKRVTKHIQLEQWVSKLKSCFEMLPIEEREKQSPYTNKDILTSGQRLLTDLGIVAESGSKDLLAILHYLHQLDKEKPIDHDFPLLRDILYHVAQQYVGANAEPKEIKRESRAMEQRIRRAIELALTNVASIGLFDYANSTFERYASTLFEFPQVRKKMTQLQDKSSNKRPRIHMKRFIQVLYLEAKQEIQV